MNQESDNRAYSSPLRERLAQQTRATILEGLAALIEEQGSEEISFAAVARRAGVSERTIYRHFASREELLSAFWSWINAEIGMQRYPETPAELRELLPQVFAGFERREGLIRGYLASRSGEALQRQVIPERREKIAACLSVATAGLLPEDAVKLQAVIQLLFSSRAWLSMRDNWDMDAIASSAAAVWAVDVLLREARRMQKTAAAKGSPAAGATVRGTPATSRKRK